MTTSDNRIPIEQIRRDLTQVLEEKPVVMGTHKRHRAALDDATRGNWSIEYDQQKRFINLDTSEIVMAFLMTVLTMGIALLVLLPLIFTDIIRCRSNAKLTVHAAEKDIMRTATGEGSTLHKSEEEALTNAIKTLLVEPSKTDEDTKPPFT